MLSQHWTRWACTKRAWTPWEVPETAAWFSPSRGMDRVSGAVNVWDTNNIASPYVVSQATSGFRPALGTTINGRSSLVFTAGSFSHLRNAGANILAGGASRYVAAVVKNADATGGTIMSFRSGTRYWALLAHNIGGNRFYFTDGVAVNGNEVGVGPDFTTPRLIEWELTVGAPVVVRVDGVARTIVGGNLVAEDGTTGFDFATRGGAFFSFDLGDVVIASGIPSAANKAKLRTFLASESNMAPL